jgi:putative NIF3 family GTP cyclohydrolase 1 type 2
VPWKNETVDTFKSGDPNAKVTGIATTMMTTLDVLQRAAARGDNLIITHEPTFYDHMDTSKELPMGESDPVLAEKRKFIEHHHLIIWRFHDHWHRNTRDGILAGEVRALGWEKYQDATNPYLFTVPETTVGKLSDEIQSKLGIFVMRVVADRDMKVKRIAFSPGASGFRREVGALEMPDVDLLLAGEPREWETVEYVADAIAEGRHKALIILSHVPSEQFGMDECAKWLKTFVTEVPIEFVPAKDPFAPLKPPQK